MSTRTALARPTACEASAWLHIALGWRPGTPLPRHADVEKATALIRPLLERAVREAGHRQARGPERHNTAIDHTHAMRDAGEVLTRGPGVGLGSATRHAHELAQACTALRPYLRLPGEVT